MLLLQKEDVSFSPLSVQLHLFQEAPHPHRASHKHQGVRTPLLEMLVLWNRQSESTEHLPSEASDN